MSSPLPDGHPVIDIEGLRHRFEPDGDGDVLTDIHLRVPPGSFVLLTGPSGAGKTTLLTLIGGLRAPQSGRLRVLGRELTTASEQDRLALRRDIGFIFQEHNLFDELTARETLMLAMALHPPRRDARDHAQQWLDRLGIAHRADARPHAMSTGQRQRVAIARALVNSPRLILADEPTASLDAASARAALQALRTVCRQDGATVVMISHDARHREMADRVVEMVDGRIQRVTDPSSPAQAVDELVAKPT